MASPLGGLRLRACASLLLAIDFEAQPHGRPRAHPVLDEAQQQLEDYFARRRTDFELPLGAQGTEFQRRVWNQVQGIPFGHTASYGQIAQQLGGPPGIARAVGAANGANPIPIVVPCHRVVGGDGSLTGYSGGVRRKRILLDLERPGLF